MRAEQALLPALALLAPCGTVARLTRPEGDGGWSATRRHDELALRAGAAGVSLESTPSPPPTAPLDLTTALALALSGNRRIAAAEQQVAAARERVWNARGQLLPATVGSGRYTHYTDALTTRVNLPPAALRAF